MNRLDCVCQNYYSTWLPCTFVKISFSKLCSLREYTFKQFFVSVTVLLFLTNSVKIIKINKSLNANCSRQDIKNKNICIDIDVI